MSTPPWQACLFDCDGTLVDTETIVLDVVETWLAELGAPQVRTQLEDWIVGKPWRSTWLGIEEHLHRHGQVFSRAYIAEAVQQRLEPLLFQPERLLPSRFAALRHAASRMPVDIVSGSQTHEVARHLQNAGCGEVVRRIWGSDTYRHGKPDPEPYLRACASGGHVPSQCLVIEDSVVGVQSGLAAGCVVLGLAQGGMAQKLRVAGARWVWEDTDATKWNELLERGVPQES